MSDDQQPAVAGTENEADPVDAAGLPRRRLLQALGGAAGVASAGLPRGPVGRGRAQSDGNDGDWRQQQKLAPDDGDDRDQFGFAASVSADGTTAVISAFLDADPNGDQAGSAYVFSRSGGQWTQQPKLVPDDGDDGDQFGGAVSVSGDGTTAVIGTPGDADPNGGRAGSAYAFTTQSPDAMPTRTATPSPSPTQSTGTATPTTATTGSDPGTASTTTTETATTANGPGFGGLTAAAAVGIVGYLLRRRRHSGSDD